MDSAQRQELRTWAEALAGTDGERRSMGRAMLMLLDRIDELEAELLREAQAAVEPGEPTQPHDMEQELAEELAAEDTGLMSLRDRLRAHTHRSSRE
ncbi:MAG: hypothetical protein ACJ740_03915 [Gaiellales bacterium]